MPRCPSKLRSGANAAKSNTATATTATADPPGSQPCGARYVGRFAPSPTGDLHLGSLYTAAASFLDARAHHGRWLLRIEDIDTPRVVPGAADSMLRLLDAYGFEWDGNVVRQSDRVEAHRAVLSDLTARGLTFECSCSRAALAEDDRYPGHCRTGPRGGMPTATRLKVDDGTIAFEDRIQGRFRQDVAAAVGDFVLRRRDGLIAYVLAVVADDAAQGVTHVVRGADLLDNTPRQIHLQRLIGAPPVDYAHAPCLVEPDGRKLSKSARSVALGDVPPASELAKVFALLGLAPPSGLETGTVGELWAWAVANWSAARVPRRLTLPLAP